MIWLDDMVNYEALAPDAALLMDRIVDFCVANRCRKVTLMAALHAAFAQETLDALAGEGAGEIAEQIGRAVEQALRDATLAQLRDTLFNLASARTARGDVDYFMQYAWTPAAAQALADAEGRSSDGPVDLKALLWGILSVLHDLPEDAQELDDHRILQAMLDTESLLGVARNLLALSGGGAQLFGEDGSLNPECLAEDAARCLNAALEIAQQRGAARVQLLMLFKALLDDSQGFALQALEQAFGVGQRAETALEQLGGLLAPSAGVTYRSLALARDSFAADAQRVLTGAYAQARAQGRDRLTNKWILVELLQNADDLLTGMLSGTLKIDLEAYRRSAAALEEGTRRALPLPVELCACREIEPDAPDAIEREAVESQILRALFDRRKPAALVYGDAGVGKSTTAERVGRRAAAGEIDFLPDIRAVVMDFHSIPEELVAGRCAALLEWMLARPKNLYIVEGFARLMQHRGDELKRAMAQGKLMLIGIVSNKEKEGILKDLDDADRYFAQVETPEPDSALTLAMVERLRSSLTEELGVAFEEGLFERARKMADDYLISRRNPYKLIDLVREAAMEAAFQRGAGAEVTRADVAGQVSKMTGLPAETILGTGEDKDFEAILGLVVKGQSMAVRKAAQRMDMIQKGLVDKKRPPAIFMFVGLSGTGKTELAKSIAQVYSSSHTLITYAMENFKAAHDVSGLIGTSQGYVGYEEGGKLINDLNRDPYATVLFDEVEKAHPAIWDPFLHLFDEGSVTDMRGVTAYGNKAFFIMTSNIGYQKLCRMLREGKPEEEIEAAITEDIYAATHQQSGEKCFRPEFVGRITRGGGIIVFSPLSLEALEGITGHTANTTLREWNSSRDVQLVIENEVIRDIARRSFEMNEQDLRGVYSTGSGTVQYKGGRIVSKLFDEEVTGRLASAMRNMKDAKQVRVLLRDGRIALDILGGGEVEAVQKSRREVLADRLATASGIAAVPGSADALASLNDDDVETMLGALETLRKLQAKMTGE